MSSETNNMPISSGYQEAMVAQGRGVSGGGAADHNMFSPAANSSSSSSPGRPQGCISKPIRRRSRASRRTPTTLLNADATNFRALVQQFTGCTSAPSLLRSTRRGPINLSFGQGMSSTDQEHHHHHHHHHHHVATTAISIMDTFGLNNYNQAAAAAPPRPYQPHHPHHQLEQQQEEPLALYQDHECMFAPNNNNDTNTGAFFTTFNDSYFFRHP